MNYKNLRVLTASIAAIGVFAGFTPAAWAGLSGSCGMLTAFPHPFIDSYLAYNGTVTSAASGGYNMSGTITTAATGTKDMDVLAVINFSTNTITFNVTEATISASGVTYSPAAATASFNPPAAGSGPVPGSYTISFTPPGSPNAVTLNILPVNGGNTFLVQGVGDPFHGVCQAL